MREKGRGRRERGIERGGEDRESGGRGSFDLYFSSFNTVTLTHFCLLSFTLSFNPLLLPVPPCLSLSLSLFLSLSFSPSLPLSPSPPSPPPLLPPPPPPSLSLPPSLPLSLPPSLSLSSLSL